jgi:hypothetical protein
MAKYRDQRCKEGCNLAKPYLSYITRVGSRLQLYKAVRLYGTVAPESEG